MHRKYCSVFSVMEISFHFLLLCKFTRWRSSIWNWVQRHITGVPTYTQSWDQVEQTNLPRNWTQLFLTVGCCVTLAWLCLPTQCLRTLHVSHWWKKPWEMKCLSPSWRRDRKGEAPCCHSCGPLSHTLPPQVHSRSTAVHCTARGKTWPTKWIAEGDAAHRRGLFEALLSAPFCYFL